LVAGPAGAAAGAVGGAAGADTSSPPPPKPASFFKQLGLELLEVKDSPENEQQTERLKKSTARAIAKVVEPSIFYSNTIDFNYNF
jgi:hypothetical protein